MWTNEWQKCAAETLYLNSLYRSGCLSFRCLTNFKVFPHFVPKTLEDIVCILAFRIWSELIRDHLKNTIHKFFFFFHKLQWICCCICPCWHHSICFVIVLPPFLSYLTSDHICWVILLKSHYGPFHTIENNYPHVFRVFASIRSSDCRDITFDVHI